MSKIRVYSKDKYIGIEANGEGLDLAVQSLGITAVITEDNFEITQEAYDLLQKTQRGNDDIGEVDCFMSGENIIFGWMGMTLALFDSDHIMGSSDFDFTLLESFITEIEIPEEFTELCDVLIQRDLDAIDDLDN